MDGGDATPNQLLHSCPEVGMCDSPGNKRSDTMLTIRSYSYQQLLLLVQSSSDKGMSSTTVVKGYLLCNTAPSIKTKHVTANVKEISNYHKGHN